MIEQQTARGYNGHYFIKVLEWVAWRRRTEGLAIILGTEKQHLSRTGDSDDNPQTDETIAWHERPYSRHVLQEI